MHRFVPSDWFLSDSLKKWTLGKGLTESMIDSELELFRLYEWDKPKTNFNRCWQTRILLGIDKGWIKLPVEHTYRQPEVISEKQRQLDILAFENDPLIRRPK